MKKIYHLKTCDTCKKIIKSLPNTNDFIFQEIKENPITETELEELYSLTNSYETLFNKRAKLYKELGLKDKSLSEKDYRNYILEHYTFLNRPVIVIDNTIFVGNSPKTILAAIEHLK